MSSEEVLDLYRSGCKRGARLGNREELAKGQNCSFHRGEKKCIKI